MLVDNLSSEWAGGGAVRRSARLRFDDGEEHECSVTVPEGSAPRDADDASGPLPLALLLAMDRGEDLVVEGRACPRLLGRIDRIRDLFLAYEPSLHPSEVRVRGALDAPAGEGPRQTGCFFSRGVDSMYAAAEGRSRDGRIDALVYADRFEPMHGEATRAAELEAAHEAARLLGLPLVVVEAVVRAPVDGRRDWEDAVGATLAWLAHALAGGFERMVVPPSDTIWRLGPSGSNPVLDALFATDAMELEHADVVPLRVDKVAWLARERPELLPLLKVCFLEDRQDNCGICAKCLWTMAALRAVGALEQATTFPAELDLDRVAGVHMSYLHYRHQYAGIVDAAQRRGDRELAAAVRHALERSAHEAPLVGARERPSFRRSFDNAIITAVTAGVRDPRAGDDVSMFSPALWEQPRLRERVAPPRGLVRALDHAARRHRYAAGQLPPGQVVGELGTLLAPGEGPGVPLWIDADGGVRTPGWPSRPIRAGAWDHLRHVVAPLTWRGEPGAQRARTAAQRALDVALRAVSDEAPEGQATPAGRPAGFLHAEPGEGRVPLYGGVHPVTGDQLLTSEQWEPVDTGYGDVALLGHLEARAPVTGLLGLHRRVPLPWASRRGLRVRSA